MSARVCAEKANRGEVPTDTEQIAAIDEWLSAWAGRPHNPQVDRLLDERDRLTAEQNGTGRG